MRSIIDLTRKEFSMKQAILLIAFVCLVTQSLSAMTADEVLLKVEKRYIGNTSKSDLYMKLSDPSGNTRTRTLTIYRRKTDEKIRDTFIHFLSPPDIRNTTYLVNEINRERQKWIYLSAFKNIRRIVASDFGMAFVSSDFTYEDMDDIYADEYATSKLESEKIDDKEVYSIECVKKGENSNYSRIIMKVWKDESVILKALMYDKSDPNKLVKEMTAEDLRKVQDIWTPYKVTMKNLLKKTSTLLEIKEINYDLQLDAEIFTQRNMKK